MVNILKKRPSPPLVKLDGGGPARGLLLPRQTGDDAAEDSDTDIEDADEEILGRDRDGDGAFVRSEDVRIPTGGGGVGEAIRVARSIIYNSSFIFLICLDPGGGRGGAAMVEGRLLTWTCVRLFSGASV